MKFLQAEIAYVRYHLAEIRDDWNDPRAHLREAHKGLDAIEVGLQRLQREFAARVREKERACPYKHDHLRGCAVTDHLDEMSSAELEGEGVEE